MQKFDRAFFFLMSVGAVLLFTAAGNAQTNVPTSAPGKTVFRDSDGVLISNNEFVDIRMANFTYPDATLVKASDDGTVEFRLQKVPQEGMRAADFTVKTLDGRTIHSSELKGKVVVLNFWFIGCPSCRAHQPKLNELKAKFAGRDDVVFLAITADPASDVKKYLSKERFDYPQTTDADALIKAFKVAVYPKNIVIDKNGEIVYWRSTIAAWDKFESVIRKESAKN